MTRKTFNKKWEADRSVRENPKFRFFGRAPINPQKRTLLMAASILMFISASPMLLWCINLINTAALDYTYAGAGCFAAALMYAFSLVTAIMGLVFAKRVHRHCWCRVMGSIQLGAGVILIIPLSAYAVLTLPPLFILTILYLVGARKRSDEKVLVQRKKQDQSVG